MAFLRPERQDEQADEGEDAAEDIGEVRLLLLYAVELARLQRLGFGRRLAFGRGLVGGAFPPLMLSTACFCSL
jgi:hypothetical protein